MVATMESVDAILKEIYGPRIENQLQNEVVALKRIERSSDGVVETPGGKYVDFPIRVSRNTGIGNRAENELLPAAGKQGYAEVHVRLKYAYGRIRVTGQVMQLADKNPQAFASAMDNEMDYLKDDLSKDGNRQVYGDGTGSMATFTAGATSTSQAVDTALYLQLGMKVDIYDGDTLVDADNVITDIDGLTVTFQDSFTSTTTAKIYRAGNKNREVSGLGAIVDDDTSLHGLSPTEQRLWKAVINDNGGVNRALSESLMIRVCDDVKVNGGKVSVILTSLGVRRAYFNLLTQQRRYTDTKEFAGGFQGLPFNYGTEVPVVEDVDHPGNELHFLDESKLKIYRTKEWHWAQDDGNILKWVTDYDAWEAFMRQYWELGTVQRNAHGKLADVTEG